MSRSLNHESAKSLKQNSSRGQESFAVPAGERQSVHKPLEDSGKLPVKIKLEKGAELECVVSYFGGSDVEAKIEIELSEGSTAAFLGIILCRGNAAVNLDICTHHVGPNSSADVQVNGVVTGDSVFNFGGLIKIEPKGQQTSSFLTNKILTLGAKAKATTNPSLEIEADDVEASHAATVGPIDQEQVFYLMSRGVSKKEAEDAIVEGFLTSVIETVKDESIGAELLKELAV